MSWQELEHMLLSLNDANNEKRHHAEEAIKSLQQTPDLAVGLTVQVLRQSTNETARETAGVVFRHICFSILEGPLWLKASPEIRRQCRAELLAAIEMETEDRVRRKICDAVVEVGRRSLEAGTDCGEQPQDEPWPELLQALFRLTQMPAASHRTAALHVFSNLPNIFGAQLPQYLHVIKDILAAAISEQEPSLEVRIAAVQAALGFILFLDTKQEKNLFQPLLSSMLQLLVVCLTTNNAKATDVLQSFIELAENSPSFLRPMLENVVQAMTQIADNVQVDDECRRLAVEVLASYIEQKPAQCRKLSYISAVIPVALKMMTEVEEDEDWDNTDDVDSEMNDTNSTVGEQVIDRVACALGGNAVFPVVFGHVQGMIQHQDWKHRHGALMAISAIGEGCKKTMEAKLSDIVQGVLPYLRDPHPRVRYAACNALGQLSTDFAPQFQEAFHSNVLPAFLACLEDSNVRVQAHSAAAMVNFTEAAPKAILGPYLDAIFTKLLLQLGSQRRIVLEQAVTTIATVADTSEEMFVKYYDTFMPQLINIMVHAQDKTHKLLRGKTIECIGLVGLAVGAEKFRADALKVMEILIKTPAEEMEPDDPQISYMLATWARLCKILGRDFIPYLPTVMPPLLRSATLKPDVAIMDSDENPSDTLDAADGWKFLVIDNQRVGIKTSVLEEKCTACEMLVCYAKELKGGLAAYLQEVMQIMVPLLKFYFHDGVRLAAAACMGPLLECAADGNMGPEFVRSSWDYILSEYLPVLEAEPDPEMVMEVMDNFRPAIDSAGPNNLNAEQMEKFAAALIEQLNQAFQRTAQRHEARQDQEDYDDEIEEGLEEGDVTDELIVKGISEAVHGLFVQNKTALLPMFERMLPVVSKMLEPTRSANDRQWALCIFDDLVEHCGPASWNYQQYFLPAMVEYLKDPEPEVKHAAAYGIGVAAQYGGPMYHQACTTALPLLVDMIQNPKARDEDNIHATDNAISAVGRICQFVPGMECMLPQWLGWLPIVTDTEEAIHCNKLLCSLIESNNPSIVRPEHMHHIAVVLATVVGSPLTDDGADLNQRVVNLLQRMATHSPDALNGLDPSLTQKLHQVLTS